MPAFLDLTPKGHEVASPRETLDRQAMQPARPWFVYIARCADGTLYTGITLNVAERIARHERGHGARYTRGRGPLEVCAVRRCASKGDALRLELAIKRLPRSRKEALTRGRQLAAFARASERSVKRGAATARHAAPGSLPTPA